MKKICLLLALALLLAPVSAFALTCETSQAIGGPDACYTQVTLSSGETGLVSQGTALVWEIDATTPAQGGYQVVRSRNSADNAYVAGFAQSVIRSGDSAMIMVRGFGYVRTTGGIASGDALTLGNSGYVNAVGAPLPQTYGASGYVSMISWQPVAVALQTSGTNGTTARRAYIKVM